MVPNAVLGRRDARADSRSAWKPIPDAVLRGKTAGLETTTVQGKIVDEIALTAPCSSFLIYSVR